MNVSSHPDDERFAAELAGFELFIQEAHPSARWTRVVVHERPDNAPPWRPGVKTFDPSGYGERFSEVLASTSRNWVNLTASTIDGDTLVVDVEWIPDLEGSKRLQDARLLSINHSGFTRGQAARIGLAGSGDR
jgi:hypothetical protein